MSQAALQPRISFEEYIDICAQTDESYELVRGELVRMTPPTWQHIKIAKFLERTFDVAIEQAGYPWEAFQKMGQRTEHNSSRLLDISIVRTAAIEQILNQTAVLTVAAPLVVEIISPNSATEDYTDKLREYEALGISEYWTVDYDALGAAKYIGSPKAPTVTVHTLVDGRYQAKHFRGDALIASPTFKKLSLTANQVFSAERTRG